jgi:hypothetical protein
MKRAVLVFSMLGTMVALLACTSESRTEAGSAGKSGAGGALGTGGASTTAGTGGGAGIASGGRSGGGGGTGSGGLSGSGGGAIAGTGGSAAAGSGGSSPSDGAAGDSTGPSDADSTTTDVPKSGVASSLDGFLIEMPCGQLSEADQVCTVAAKYDKQSFTVNVGGDTATEYDVTLRVRGVMEPLTYAGGVSPASVGPHYYVGGAPVDKWYRIYSLKTSAPAQIYYFNAAPSVGHIIFAIDYTVTIPMRGGSTITLVSDGQNGNSIANFSKLTVPGVPLTQPYGGQFMYLTLVSAKAKQGA